jgi:endonuclease/exonuclease/phosphatase family metal-dependent hydrolase
MRVVSWNIHRCFGTDGQYRPERIAQILNDFDADFIALQEVDSSLRVADERDQLRYLADATGLLPIMGPTLLRDYGAYGNAILSRHPIYGWEEYDLSYRRFEPRGALAVTAEVEGRRFRMVNVHLGLYYWERVFQIDRLLSDLVWKKSEEGMSSSSSSSSSSSEQEPTILLGDFNEWFPFAPNNFRLSRAFSEYGPKCPTFPSGWPRLSLDRVYLSGSVRGDEYRVVRDGLHSVASDHLPVVADLSLN